MLFHRRRSFSESDTALLADLISLQWSVEAMVSLKIDKVMFETSSGVLREAFSRSSSIPYVNQLVSEILQCLNFFSDWRLDHVEKEGNRMATLIAHSVISDQRLQSYVATCGSSWLHHLLAQESAMFPPITCLLCCPLYCKEC